MASVDDVAACFSESYEEARSKFLAAAKEKDAEMHSLPVTEDEDGKYTIDVAVLRKPGKGVVVISSGTHGVEGYAGSGIQLGLLRHWQELSIPVTAVFIHAVNPFGMAHFRRFNEHNVDLNRNCLLPHEFEKLQTQDQIAPLYDSFDPVFNPTSPPSWFYRNMGVWVRMASYVAAYGIGYIKTALVGGTYTKEKGIFYGGRELEPSHVLLRDFFKEQFGGLPAREIAWVDVHTGLGPQGVDVLLGSEGDRQTLEEKFPKVDGEFDGVQVVSGERGVDLRCAGEGLEVNSARFSSSQSAGYEYTVGVLSAPWVTQWFPPDSGRVLMVQQEFGTLPPMAVARALMLENSGFHYDRSNHHFWRTFTQDAFYVRTDFWKERVLRRGMDVFQKMAKDCEEAHLANPRWGMDGMESCVGWRAQGKNVRRDVFSSGKGRGRGRGATNANGKQWSAQDSPAQAPAPVEIKEAPPKIPPEPPVDGTTIMLRNLPAKFSQQSMLQLLNDNGFQGKYDFVYLPMDFRNGTNLGYAFVNTLTHQDALEAMDAYQGFTGWADGSDKVCEVSWAHPHQGLEEHVERYRNSPVMHPVTPEEYKPMVFANGQRVPFPAPTKAIRAPKMKSDRSSGGAAALTDAKS
ncbi:mei2 [Symbiodinium natans]|uniref:Mei2 protein n=1 Tax=Symbiodinium natans TaxID=878477 RepID=A0A812T0W1_9DINO|nr:mei2 [Symbiodinium natans]